MPSLKITGRCAGGNDKIAKGIKNKRKRIVKVSGGGGMGNEITEVYLEGTMEIALIPAWGV